MFILRARHLLPTPERAIENGAVAIEGSKVVAVGKYPDVHRGRPCEVIDLGENIVLPGLINAHTHLELTALLGAIKPTNSFTNWLIKVLRARLSWGDEELDGSVQDGARMSVESGTTTLGDISTTGHAFKHLLQKSNRVRKIVFHEVIDLNPSTAEETAQCAREKITGFLPPPHPQPPFTEAEPAAGNLLIPGISPHAPYTVSRELYRRCTTLSRDLNVPICTHVAETEDEIEFLTSGTGGFATLLRARRMLDDHWQPPGLLPVEYLKDIGALKGPCMLIHCNYLSDKEMSIIKESGASVVFCPRSHRFFGHTDHPFRELMSKGVNVALGTDSLASNSSLSMLDEMRFLHERHPGLEPQRILSMTTTNGARALGIEGAVGALADGLEADITVIESQGGHKGDIIYERLLDGASRSIMTIVAGEVCYDRYGLINGQRLPGK